jgi:hypothetical protein
MRFVGKHLDKLPADARQTYINMMMRYMFTPQERILQDKVDEVCHLVQTDAIRYRNKIYPKSGTKYYPNAKVITDNHIKDVFANIVLKKELLAQNRKALHTALRRLCGAVADNYELFYLTPASMRHHIFDAKYFTLDKAALKATRSPKELDALKKEFSEELDLIELLTIKRLLVN